MKDLTRIHLYLHITGQEIAEIDTKKGQLTILNHTLMVIGVSTVPEAACMTLFIRIGFVRRADPAPLLTTISMGHPILRSIKSTEHSCSMSSTVLETVSGYAAQI